MSRQLLFALSVLALLVLLLVSSAVYFVSSYLRAQSLPVQETRRSQAVVDAADVEAARLEMVFPAGTLALVGGGTEHLAEAEFRYNMVELAPTVRYVVTGTVGTLIIKPESAEIQADQVSDLLRFRNTRNNWFVRLGDQTPLFMDVVMGAAEGRMELGGLALTGLTVEAGAGALWLDLTGDWAHSFPVTVQGGIGEMHIRLPQEVGVRVQVTQGMGDVAAAGLQSRDGYLVNAAYGRSPVTIDLVVEGGIGEIELDVVGDIPAISARYSPVGLPVHRLPRPVASILNAPLLPASPASLHANEAQP